MKTHPKHLRTVTLDTCVVFLVMSASVWSQGTPTLVEPSIENRLLHGDDPGNAAERTSSSASLPTSGGYADTGIGDPNNVQAGDLRIVASSMGYGFTSGSPDFGFGDVITPPLVDVDGAPLSPEQALEYWRARPLGPGEEILLDSGRQTPLPADTPLRYYYSPHAEKVYASHSGAISIVWVKAAPTASGVYSIGSRQDYSIGAVAGPTTAVRNIYWTKNGYLAPHVEIPGGFVQALTLVYNDQIPDSVSLEENVVESGANTDAKIVRQATQSTPARYGTVWQERGQGFNNLHAANREGLMLIEYLGDVTGDRRQHLGLEVLNVRKLLTPTVVDTFIGEQVLPGVAPGEFLADGELVPRIPATVPSSLKLHIDGIRNTYYGVRQNLLPPETEIYWLRPAELSVFIQGEAPLEFSIAWPEIRNQYRVVWPEDIGDYAVFVRPNGEGEESYLDLISTNLPELVYNDGDEDQLTEVEIEHPFHLKVDLSESADGYNRALLRFNNGNRFWYSRIYSAIQSHLTAFYGDTFYSTESVRVGQRLEPPAEGYAPGGYVDTTGGGNAYDVTAYIDPFADGGLEAANQGAVIPVNALPGNNTLRVWWFKALRPEEENVELAEVFDSIQVPGMIVDYTISYPAAGDSDEIILASNQGTGDLPVEVVDPSIYVQNDPASPGYNPNEEHAQMIAGRGYALRDDLNGANSSEPFVLISHKDENDRPDMRIFKVLRENDEYEFRYPAVAGTIIEAPFPLPVLPKPVENFEPVSATPDPVANGPAVNNLTHYDKFTFKDRKNNDWIYRGPHVGNGSAPELAFQFYYFVQEGFAFPGNASPPATGDVVPYLSPDGSADPIGAGIPLTIAYTPQWPEQTPVLHFGETLAKARFGLPQVLGASSAELIYQQSIAADFSNPTPSALLHDPLIRRISELSDQGLAKIPAEILTTDSRGRTYFQNLPSHLQDRIYYDNLIGTAGALVLEGRFVDELAGEDYFQLNTLSPGDLDILKGLYTGSDTSAETKWHNLVEGLKHSTKYRYNDKGDVKERTFVEWLDVTHNIEDESDFIGSDVKGTYLPTDLIQITDSDQLKGDYAVTAVGGGEGYVTLVTGNGEVNSEEGEPVQMHIFRVGEKLYRGELKPLLAANPLSEKVTVIHTGDFAARPDAFDFEWKKAPPIDGLAPAVYEFSESYEGLYDAFSFAETTTTGYRDQSGSLILTFPANSQLETVFLSVNLPDDNGVILKANGVEVVRFRAPEGEDTELASDIPTSIRASLVGGADNVVFRVSGRSFAEGGNPLDIELFTDAATAAEADFELRVAIQTKVDKSINYQPATNPTEIAGKRNHDVSGSGIDTLGDNYFIMRYTPNDPGHPLTGEWSEWTRPALVEGWIKRVLAGINPFNQRLTDFFENAVDTNVSIITQAGSRWEGDIPLTLDAVQDAGLIEIYETVLKRGINLSIDGTPSVDYAPANDALLLAAGYLNDLYVALGNEAFADAANPTVTFDGQALGTLGDAAITAGFEENFRSTSTSRFAFQGQVPTLLDEELALLRGRDDFLSPSVETPPVYNRLFWNYTRGIDAGELIYALNYNIREVDDAAADGKVDATDAAHMFPQAHGDAYGHYLTAVKNYYRLLTDPEFTWQPRIEAVNVLGQPVSIDYFDERKFASSAAALARTADQILGLQRRKAYQEPADGWENLDDARENSRTNTIRHWGVDDWASRGMQGAYYHWIVGNAILPHEDTVHEGIQKIDRTTVPELDVLAKTADKIQKQLQAADARVNPLDLTGESLLMDISPADLAEGKTHFEQIYERALTALKNASSVFERASESTRLLRSMENQSQNLNQVIADEETAFIAELIGLYGEAYSGDIGPGKLFPDGYGGPDLIRFNTIDRPFDVFTKDKLYSYEDDGSKTFTVNVANSSVLEGIDPLTGAVYAPIPIAVPLAIASAKSAKQVAITKLISDNQGPYEIADDDLGRRASLGVIQTTLNEVRLAEEKLYVGLNSMQLDRKKFQTELELFTREFIERETKVKSQFIFDQVEFGYNTLKTAIEALEKTAGLLEKNTDELLAIAVQGVPTIVGTSNDIGAPVTSAILAAAALGKAPLTVAQVASAHTEAVADFAFLIAEKALELGHFTIDEAAYYRGQIARLRSLYKASYGRTREVDALAVEYRRALEDYRTELSNGRTVLANREVFRKRAAAAIQGYRTRDVAFRTFRTEALEEYQTLLDWASRYAFLAAQAYDYETGLLGSLQGQAFLGEIIGSRALGILDENGHPTVSASATGDPGLSGLLAKLKSDFDVVKGRLGFNNPETNGTTVSLRREYFRIPDGTEGDVAWRQKLESFVKNDLLIDADIAAHAIQLGGAEAVQQPGFLLSFPSAIEDGRNFFGLDLRPGDSTFTTTHFATKVHSLGVVFDNYRGMSPCLICQNGPGDPTHNHDDALSATPYVYLIPTGLDTMRTSLGDVSSIRSWSVQDYAMPLPFDIGSFELSAETIRESNNNLRSNFRSPRRHPSFRAIDRADFFYTDFAEDYTSSRLVGRSVWNSQWKLAIPARGLLANEQEAIARFIRSVKDIKLHLKTYSYSSN